MFIAGLFAMVLGGALVVAARRAAHRVVRRAGLGVAGALVGLGALAIVAWAWAHTATGESQLARSIVWGDSDVGDIDRFPTREVRASNPVPLVRSSTDSLAAHVAADADGPLAGTFGAHGTVALIAIRDGVVVHEQYREGVEAADLHTSFSVAKSVVATLVGVAIADGSIDSLDAPITRWLPELSERDERFGQITVRHLLSMSSGLSWDEGSSPWADPADTYYGTDLRRAALETTDVERAPGEVWRYNDWNTILLGLILERATGSAPADYLETEVWGPIGAEGDASWSLDSDDGGFEKSFVGVNARPVDFARLGLLYLDGGSRNGVQILPASYVAEATAASTADNGDRGYQYQWWVDEAGGGFYAAGDHCQFIYVHPPSNAVVARFGSGCGGVDWPTALRGAAGFLDD